MPFKKLKFKFPWRNYQQSFLNNFKKHIEDNHLHVIAPPGSGKTILGLEIMRQVGKRTLVLAPTLTIRDQWENRLQSFFIEKESFEEYSFDINNPKSVTFLTYQSLHAFYKRFDNKESYFNYFKKNKIEVLILDEAHHLKNEWWRCLYELKEQHKLTTIALTGTPPYDSEAIEVSKYFKLCGEIDDEIAVPDLVKEGDLCPHQDYIYFSEPSDLEINAIVNYRLKISYFIDSISTNEDFIAIVANHRFLKETEKCLEEIYNVPDYFSSLLIFLKSIGKEISKDKLKVLGFEENDKIDFPIFDLHWATVLLQNIIVNDRMNLVSHEFFLSKIETEIRKLNVFDKSKIDFVGDKVLYRSLSNSSSKLESIVTVIAHEQRQLKEDLRAVILTDYIKKEFLEVTSISEINRLGVLPIFHFLRTKVDGKQQLAVLSGTIVILHKSVIAVFELFDTIENYTISSLNCDSDFLNIISKSTNTNNLVTTVTKLFEEGYITKLIGTKSLLGEGWDAPSINTLILASFVGSFVSSNQMRGRAIRSEKNNDQKTGNIWHLVCIDSSDEKGGKDMETLKRRFDAFVGISNSDKVYIENGIDRLNLPNTISNFENLNSLMLAISNKRTDLFIKWKNAIQEGSSLSREIKQYYENEIPYNIEKKKKFNDIIKYSLVELGIGLSFFVPEFLVKNLNVLLSKGILAFVYSILIGLGLTFGVKSYKIIKNYLKFGFLFKILPKIGEALKESLVEMNFITTKSEAIFIKTDILPKGDVVVSINGTNDFESALFINSLEEILEPIKNPRYLILHTNWFKNELNIQNFYVVPQLFGDKKKNCLVFEKHWNQQVGKSKFIYTRHLEGRKMLLKARLLHVSNAFKKNTKKGVIWN